MKKFFKIILVFIVIGGLVLHFYLPRIITEIKSPLTFNELKDVKIPKGFIRGDFKSLDGFNLKYYIKYSTDKSAKGTIILLHGIRSRKEQYINLSNYLSEKGYNSIALDLRAHGESEGVHCTFGVKEKQDIVLLLDELKTKGIKGKIGVWGQSLGAAIALQAASIDNRIQFTIAESTFTNLETISGDYMELNLGFKSKWLNQYLIYRAGKIAEFNPDETSPYQACLKINKPTLIVHGNKDKRIDIQYGKENFINLNTKQKQFLEIDNATHLNVWEIGGKEYFKSVLKFIEEV